MFYSVLDNESSHSYSLDRIFSDTPAPLRNLHLRDIFNYPSVLTLEKNPLAGRPEIVLSAHQFDNMPAGGRLSIVGLITCTAVFGRNEDGIWGAHVNSGVLDRGSAISNFIRSKSNGTVCYVVRYKHKDRLIEATYMNDFRKLREEFGFRSENICLISGNSNEITNVRIDHTGNICFM